MPPKRRPLPNMQAFPSTAVSGSINTSKRRATGLNSYIDGNTMAPADPRHDGDAKPDFERGVATALHAMEAAKRAPSCDLNSWIEIEARFSHSGSGLENPREWPSLGALTKEDIANLLSMLKDRASAARSAFAIALYKLKIQNEIFSAPHTPNDIRTVIVNYRRTSNAGHNIFAPQKAYQTAIVKLRLFVIDLLNLLPSYLFVKHMITPVFNKLVQESHDLEEKVRAQMHEVGKDRYGNAGRERYRVNGFLEQMNARLVMLEREERKLGGWAAECVAAIPTAEGEDGQFIRGQDEHIG